MSVFGDLVALARAGYTPAQVKEILSMQTEEAKSAEEPTETAPKEVAQPETEKAPEPNPTDGKDSEDTLAELQKKLAAAEEKLADLQKQNSTKDISTQKPQTNPLDDMVRRFM